MIRSSQYFFNRWKFFLTVSIVVLAQFLFFGVFEGYLLSHYSSGRSRSVIRNCEWTIQSIKTHQEIFMTEKNQYANSLTELLAFPGWNIEAFDGSHVDYIRSRLQKCSKLITRRSGPSFIIVAYPNYPYHKCRILHNSVNLYFHNCDQGNHDSSLTLRSMKYLLWANINEVRLGVWWLIAMLISFPLSLYLFKIKYFRSEPSFSRFSLIFMGNLIAFISMLLAGFTLGFFY